jgi:hypothetical protein
MQTCSTPEPAKDLSVGQNCQTKKNSTSTQKEQFIAIKLETRLLKSQDAHFR